MAKKTRKQKEKTVQKRTLTGIHQPLSSSQTVNQNSSHLAYRFSPAKVTPPAQKTSIQTSTDDQELSKVIRKEIYMTVTLATIAVIALFILSKIV
jgi:hypothetical protein